MAVQPSKQLYTCLGEQLAKKRDVENAMISFICQLQIAAPKEGLSTSSDLFPRSV